VIASIVDVGALWQTIWSATLAGILTIACCSVAVLGAARAQEHRAAGDRAAAVRWVMLAVVGGAAMTAVVVSGLLLVVR
jgi:hypothetical protein